MTLQDDINNIYKLDKGFSDTCRWKPYHNRFHCNYEVREVLGSEGTVCGNLSEDEAGFIAAAPLMVSVIRRLEALVETLRNRDKLTEDDKYWNKTLA